MQHWPHKFAPLPHAQSSPFLLSLLCTSISAASLSWVFWSHCISPQLLLFVLALDVEAESFLKPAEQSRSKRLQHLFLCNASGAAVDFLNNTFKSYFKKDRNKLDAMRLREFHTAVARVHCAGALSGFGLLFRNAEMSSVGQTLYWSCCVLVISVLEWSPLEDARESRLRSVIKQHCHSANFCFKRKAPHQRKKKYTSSRAQALATTSDHIFFSRRRAAQFLVLTWRGTRILSLIDDLIWNWPWQFFFFCLSLFKDFFTQLLFIHLWGENNFSGFLGSLCFTVPLSWPSWWSCWRALWWCRSRCWEGRASWWLVTCFRRYGRTSTAVFVINVIQISSKKTEGHFKNSEF